jgi:hypothetical protein
MARILNILGLMAILVFGTSSFALAQNCGGESAIAKAAVNASKAKTLKVTAAQTGSQYADYNIYTGTTELIGMFANAYYKAVELSFNGNIVATGAFIALDAPVVVEVTFNDGSKMSFVHVPGELSQQANVPIPATAYTSSGAAACPQNNNNNSNNGTGAGAGSPGGSGGGIAIGGGTTTTCYLGDGDDRREIPCNSDTSP